MSHQNQSEEQLENILSAVTDALLAGEGDIDHIIERYNVPGDEVRSLAAVIQRMHVTLVGVQPSRRFVQRLKNDLMGTLGWQVVTRVRRLPARVQVAAGIALVAGFMLFTRRRLMEDVTLEEQEAPALQ